MDQDILARTGNNGCPDPTWNGSAWIHELGAGDGPVFICEGSLDDTSSPSIPR